MAEGDDEKRRAVERLLGDAADLVAARSTWIDLAEVCRRLGLSEDAVLARAGEVLRTMPIMGDEMEAEGL